MVKREEVEFILAACEPGSDSFLVALDNMTRHKMRELAGTWLAVDGAPVGVAKEVGGSMVVIGGLSEPFRASAAQVKLVLVPEAGGGEG